MVAGLQLTQLWQLVGDTIPSRDKSFDQFQPKISLTTSADNTTVYASYGVGFRSGGFNSSGSAATTDFWLNSGNPFGSRA